MAEHLFKVRDVRLHGWAPDGDYMETNFDTPSSWIISQIKSRAATYPGQLVVDFMCHGLPGFLLCAQGRRTHPTAGNGLSEDDILDFGQLKGLVKRFEFRACLVARMGTCPECHGHIGWDGNRFCYRFAQATQAQVKASLHLQYGSDGTDGDGNHVGPSYDCAWAGRVYTWGPKGNILRMEDFPYIPDDATCIQ